MTDKYRIECEADYAQVVSMRNAYLEFISNNLLKPNCEKELNECLDTVERYQQYLNDYKEFTS